MIKKLNSDIGYEILNYLVKNYESKSTIEAITEWWLLEQRINYEVDRVKNALDELIEIEFVLMQKGTDSRVYYCINNNMQAEIKDLIEVNE